MNNEPVAWMQTWENQNGELKQTVNIQQIGKNDIPLYTAEQLHPAKTLTLTPDEIFDVWDEHTDYDGEFIISIDDFVKAILKKASEK